jgi:hypothetical protein
VCAGFPSLISGPFKHGLTIILTFSIAMCLLAAWASWLRGAKYIHHEPDPADASARIRAEGTSGHTEPAVVGAPRRRPTAS